AAAYDELLPLRVESGVLQVRVLLVRPEPVDVVVRDALAEHITGGGGALLDGVLPVFHQNLAIEDRVIVIRDVTRGVNTAHVRLAVLVDDNAIVHMNTAASKHLHRRLD